MFGFLDWRVDRTIARCVAGMILGLGGCARTDPGVEVVADKNGPVIGVGYLTPRAIGDAPDAQPWITNLTIVDLDGDGRKDVVFCEGNRNEVRWLQQNPMGGYEERILAADLPGPAHVQAVDVDGDGDQDVLVACLGVVFPNPQRIGSVVVLEQRADGAFRPRVVLKETHRVSDVQAGDLDGDGDVDLAVAQFGYDEGEVIWMENVGEWTFTPRALLSLSGGINVPLADFNADGKLDVATVVSQEWEEVYVFLNRGERTFDQRLVFGSTNEDYGSSGITLADLDADGDVDIVYTNGDAFDYTRPGPRPWHGVQWLENDGTGQFKFHRLGDFPGAYTPKVVDLDGDGDLDVVAVSGFNHWENPAAVSLVCYENLGDRKFAARSLAHRPTHLIGLDAADMDGDGDVELVTGSFHAYPPYDHIARITLWER